MSWPLRYLAIGTVGFFAIGCSEKAEGPPTGPEFHTVVNKFSSCDVQHIGQLANSFFSPPAAGGEKIWSMRSLQRRSTVWAPKTPAST